MISLQGFYHILLLCNKRMVMQIFCNNNVSRKCLTILPAKSDSDVMFCLQSN